MTCSVSVAQQVKLCPVKICMKTTNIEHTMIKILKSIDFIKIFKIGKIFYCIDTKDTVCCTYIFIVVFTTWVEILISWTKYVTKICEYFRQLE